MYKSSDINLDFWNLAFYFVKQKGQFIIQCHFLSSSLVWRKRDFLHSILFSSLFFLNTTLKEGLDDSWFYNVDIINPLWLYIPTFRELETFTWGHRRKCFPTSLFPIIQIPQLVWRLKPATSHLPVSPNLPVKRQLFNLQAAITTDSFPMVNTWCS